MGLPVTKASDLGDDREKPRWLVEGVWIDDAVGVIGGEPKTLKTFAALELAVAVSSGRPFLRHFAVENPGRVLLFAAEDAPGSIRRRLEVIAGASGTVLENCDIHVITVPVLRIDDREHRAALTETVETMRPRLLILDPFIRLHRVDENLSGEIAPLLAYLRALQKTFSTSVAVIHHARKRAGRARAGQSLRGSSEFHAWYDSHLYLTRPSEDRLRLDIEHRSAASREGIRLDIVPRDGSLIIELAHETEEADEPAADLGERITNFLRSTPSPQSLNAIRAACRARKVTVTEQLADLVSRGALRKQPDGYIVVQ